MQKPMRALYIQVLFFFFKYWQFRVRFGKHWLWISSRKKCNRRRVFPIVLRQTQPPNERWSSPFWRTLNEWSFCNVALGKLPTTIRRQWYRGRKMQNSHARTPISSKAISTSRRRNCNSAYWTTISLQGHIAKVRRTAPRPLNRTACELVICISSTRTRRQFFVG